MRISSRGTVSMGPLGWLIIGPFILAFWLIYGLVRGVMWLGMLAVEWQAGRRARRPG